MKKFIEKIQKICEENQKVAMFIDMDGTINEYEVYSESSVAKQMEDNYSRVEPVMPIIEVIEKINKIANIDLYILSLSKTNKISEEKDIWLDRYIEFIPRENRIVLTKENGGYSSENRDIIKALKMQEKLSEYDRLILLDDDHKILKNVGEILGNKANAFHITSALI